MINKDTIADPTYKLLFTVAQLASTFNYNAITIRKMVKGVPIHSKIGRGIVYLLSDVASLNDVRDPYIPEEPKEPPPLETDPAKMNPLERIDHYKAEDLLQSSLIKKRKNNVEDGKLMVAHEVERVIAEAFKKIALTLDTLPDLLERDGIISSSDITKTIDVLDRSREQLAVDLGEISQATLDINDEGNW